MSKSDSSESDYHAIGAQMFQGQLSATVYQYTDEDGNVAYSITDEIDGIPTGRSQTSERPHIDVSWED